MYVPEWGGVTQHCLTMGASAFGAAWPILALYVGLELGGRLFAHICLSAVPQVHTGKEEEYDVPDDGYHDRYGGHAADYIDVQLGSGSGSLGTSASSVMDEDSGSYGGSGFSDEPLASSADWDSAYADRGWIDDGPDFRDDDEKSVY